MRIEVKPSGDFVAIRVKRPFWAGSKALGIIERAPKDIFDRGWALPSGVVVAVGFAVTHATVGDRVLFLADSEYAPGYPEDVVLVREGDIVATLEERDEEAKAEAKAQGVLNPDAVDAVLRAVENATDAEIDAVLGPKE
jgi:hypothetical protein